MNRSIPIAYSSSGKGLYPRRGMLVPAGSLIRNGSEWETLTAPMICFPVYVPSNPYDEGPAHMSQSGWELRPFSKSPDPSSFVMQTN